MKSYIKQYQRNQVHSASQIEQVAIVLEQAGRCMHQAIVAFEKNEVEERSNAIDKAMKLMTGLRGALDEKVEDEETRTVVEVMSSFYRQMSVFMMQANLRGDVMLCKAVERNLMEMAQMWRNAAAQPLAATVAAVQANPSVFIQA